jgi:arsenate reductase
MLTSPAALLVEVAANCQYMIYEKIRISCQTLVKEFDKIPLERKQILEKITAYTRSRMKENKPVQLVYICTHNSRRSHFGQIWATVAAAYYNQSGIHAFSGGTEATAFNVNAINALKKIGFDITVAKGGKNPVYHVQFGDVEKLIECFSKVYHHEMNPKSEFAAIMTCSDAEENCPFIPGVDFRIATTYDDPKDSDNKPLQDAAYDERCREIARDIFYVFSKLNFSTNE